MSVPAFLVLMLAGPGLLSLGIWTLRSRVWYDGIPLPESLIDRAAGIAPPPRDATDRRFARFHAWAGIALGSIFTLCLAAVLISFLSE